MGEALSPISKQRAAFSPIKSPQFAIGSNDDKLERAQARAARAAAIRRKPTVVSTSVSPEADSCLGKEQILDLFHNCIKLASENKINQKNTWELNLIDHLCEIVKVEEEDDTETNFQKASCTLEAGVRIYSMRVDSVHSEAYKVLGGINRVGHADEKDAVEDGNVTAGQAENDEKKEQGRKLSPLSTLESSFAAINVKKFDVAFAVDPLYHQTSAQFDEGGAKGLLLNNLRVYGNCKVLFDSLEVPGKCSSPVARDEGAQVIDLSFASECIERMVSDMLSSSEISPSLMAIVNQLDTDNRRQSESVSFGQVNEPLDRDDDDGVSAETFGGYGAWDDDHDDEANVIDQATDNQDTTFPSQNEAPYVGDEQSYVYDPDEDDRSEEVDSYLFVSLGFSTKQNSWAGPNHWKFRKTKEPEAPAEERGSPKLKKAKNKKADLDIDFSNTIDTDISQIFDPPKNPKSLLLPANRAPCNTRLPEDCHYQPEDLVKLFLLPHVLCLGRTRTKKHDIENQQRDGFEATASWDDGDDFGGGLDDGHAHCDVEETSTLVSQPRQVSKIEVQYDKTSKQVDVHALKETLWSHIQHLDQSPVEEESVSFKQVLANFPDSCRAAPSINDISTHLCFICLLHLANEHELRILGCPTMDDLTVHLKPQT
ncbi:condensin complex subunit 2-like [Salvia splendens]|uniref:condensin complex subunit 2-like n=1 Tax=Salvia splendens TaxID=180675 RepID=UPI001C266012|nr:condensin complex subunit 2-like [Salvia splendens]